MAYATILSLNMKIACVCYKEGQFKDAVESEDQLLLKFLRNKGLNISEVVWNDPDVKWENFNLVILKSPWDYFEDIAAFYIWLNKIDKLGLRLLNPTNVVRWNSDKHYLLEISETGLAVVPGIFLEKNQIPDLNNYFEILKTDKIIVKPCISAGSVNTHKISIKEAGQWNSKLEESLKKEAFIVQPFLKEIETEGEYSFLFFNGKYSHHVLKKAKKGDFRVQSSHGGSIHLPEVPSSLVEQAQRYVDKFADGCLYARVDGIVSNGNFILMELELIEPFLFLSEKDDSFQNYYSSLKDLVISCAEER